MNMFLLRQSIRKFAQIQFSRSGGPGGQNVNKVNTKVTLKIKLSDLAGLSEAEQDRLRETLESRISYGSCPAGGEPLPHRGPAGNTGELVISSSEERSQRINLERAYSKTEALIAASARLPKKRYPSKPSRAAKEERLRAKRQNSAKKVSRKPVQNPSEF